MFTVNVTTNVYSVVKLSSVQLNPYGLIYMARSTMYIVTKQVKGGGEVQM